MGWGNVKRAVALGGLLVAALVPLTGQVPSSATATLAPANPDFSIGTPQDAAIGATGCGSNSVSEPVIKLARDDSLLLASEHGFGKGTELWRKDAVVGGPGADACGLTYNGQPNVIAPTVGASGGDVDVAIAPVAMANGRYRSYVISTSTATLALSHSEDGGMTWATVQKVADLPIADRPFITAWGESTAVATVAGGSGRETVLRTDDGGLTWNVVGTSPGSLEFGFITADHHSTDGVAVGPNGEDGFYLFQPNTSGVAVSNDGGFTWSLRELGCDYIQGNQFPTVSVAPDGHVWVAWATGADIRTAVSADHGVSWSCTTRKITTSTIKAIEPAIIATSTGVDLAYYGSETRSTSSTSPWNLYFMQNTSGDPSVWGRPVAIVGVHLGQPCQSGIGCTSGRQLYDDFGIDVDSQGWAHITFSHDGPPSTVPRLGNAGGASSQTGYAIQLAGQRLGQKD